MGVAWGKGGLDQAFICKLNADYFQSLSSLVLKLEPLKAGWHLELKEGQPFS